MVPHQHALELPRPPLDLIGRADQLRRLVALLTGEVRSSLIIVTGRAGAGKSTLLRHAVARAQLDAPVSLSCRGGDDEQRVGERVLRALPPGARAADSADLLRDAFDAAERLGWTVVVEDLRWLAPSAVARCLETWRAGRRSRWVVCMRRPAPEWAAEAAVTLGALGDAPATELASFYRPDAPSAEIEALVRMSGGSPYWIRHLAAIPAPAPAPESALGELSDEAIRYLARQRLALTSPPGDPGEPPDAEDELRTLEQLLRGGDRESAVELVRRRHRAWISAGLGSQCWQLISGEPDLRFQPVRRRVALAVGSRSSLDWLLSGAEPERLPDKLVLVQALLHSGRVREARAKIEALSRDNPRGPEVQLVLGEVLYHAGEPSRAVRVLRAIVGLDEESSARRDLHLAQALFHAGDTPGSSALLDRVRAVFGRLSGELSQHLASERLGLLLLLGHPTARETDREDPRGVGPMNMVLRAARLLTSGDYQRSTGLLDRLERESGLPHGSGLLARIVTGIVRITRGQYTGLSSLSRHLVQEADLLGSATVYHWAFILERAVNLADAHACPELPWASSIPQPRGLPLLYLQALRASHAARRGQIVPEDEIPRARHGGPLVASACDIAAAMVHLLNGDAGRAALLAGEAHSRTVEHAHLFLEGEALLIRTYADLKLGREPELAQDLERLSTVGRNLRSKRYSVIAALIGAAQVGHLERALLATSAADSASPTAARVARCLLGAPCPEDALDRLLIRELCSRWPSRVQPLRPDVHAHWLIDPAAGLVHTRDRAARVTPLIMRILTGLFDRGGRATVAQTAKLGWNIDDFHQLRDSKRVHVAVRRLRTAIEDDPSKPRYLVTTEDGYSISTERPPGICRANAELVAAR